MKSSLQIKSFTPDRSSSTVQRVNQPTKTIINNRPSAIAQLKLQGMITQRVPMPKGSNLSLPFTANMAPIQRVQFIIGLDKITREEDDAYELLDGEDYDDDAYSRYNDEEAARDELERNAARGNSRVQREQAEAALAITQQQAEVARQQAEAELKRVAAELKRVERERIRIREDKLKNIPLTVSRRDDNFENSINDRGLGKAHLTTNGLASAGATQTTHADQLFQGSPNKGTSNLISFAGPKPGGQVYGKETASELIVKVRKIARAKAKGKADAQHLDIFTTSQILASREVVLDGKLGAYARKDDEHQVRVRTPGGVIPRTIPNRFLRGGRFNENALVDQHDSDSEDDH